MLTIEHKAIIGDAVEEMMKRWHSQRTLVNARAYAYAKLEEAIGEEEAEKLAGEFNKYYDELVRFISRREGW